MNIIFFIAFYNDFIRFFSLKFNCKLMVNFYANFELGLSCLRFSFAKLELIEFIAFLGNKV